MNSEIDNDIWETITKRLFIIIRDDNKLSEFSLIPTEVTNVDVNTSPVKYDITEHCIGLETWCFNYLLRYTYDQAFKLRQKHKKTCRDVSDTLNMYLSVALLLQPKVTTLWNIKRELYSEGSLDVAFEMRVSRLVLSNQCKSYEAFTYRRWLLEQLQPPSFNDVDRSTFYREILDSELEVLDQTTRNTPNNYHAWNHRIWCYQNITLPHLPFTFQLRELTYSENWIKSHVSEYSGFHYRQFILNCFKTRLVLPNELLNSLAVFQTDNKSNILNSMLDSEFIEKFEEIDIVLYNQYLCLLLHELFTILPYLHSMYPGHEAIWYHRRFLIHHIHEAIREIYGLKSKEKIVIKQSYLPRDVNITKTQVQTRSMLDKNCQELALESSYLYRTLFSKEITFLSSLEVNFNDCEFDLAERHRKWLGVIFGVQTNL